MPSWLLIVQGKWYRSVRKWVEESGHLINCNCSSPWLILWSCANYLPTLHLKFPVGWASALWCLQRPGKALKAGVCHITTQANLQTLPYQETELNSLSFLLFPQYGSGHAFRPQKIIQKLKIFKFSHEPNQWELSQVYDVHKLENWVVICKHSVLILKLSTTLPLDTTSWWS